MHLSRVVAANVKVAVKVRILRILDVSYHPIHKSESRPYSIPGRSNGLRVR